MKDIKIHNKYHLLKMNHSESFNNLNGYNDDNDETEQIRAPDNVLIDRLIDDYDMSQINYHDNEDIELNEIINESIMLAEKNSELKFQELIQEMNVRKEKYENIILKFKKLINYDKEAKQIFDLINPIIEQYINMEMDNYLYDIDTYNKIFNIKLLNQMRLNDIEIKLLREIILYK
jgi:hypothetical protein